MFRPALALATLLMMLAGCSSFLSSDPVSTVPVATLPNSTDHMTAEDLPLIVVPQSDFDPQFADFTPNSRWMHNDLAAPAWYIDPGFTEADVEAAGRLDGFLWEAYDRQFTAYKQGEGFTGIVTLVQLYEDEDAASAALAARQDAYEKFDGKVVEPDFTVEEVDEFTVENLGHEARGLQVTMRVKERGFQTEVHFRVGRLLGSVLVNRVDDADARRIAVEMAKILALKIVDEVGLHE